MMLGSGGGRSEEPLESLADVDRLKVRIESLYKAVEARNKSTELHKIARSEALEAAEKLRQVKAAHDAREQQLNNKSDELEKLRQYLADQIAEYSKKSDELTEEKHKFETDRSAHQQNVSKFGEYCAAKQQTISQQQLDIQQRLMAAEQKAEELKKREADTFAREQFLISAANEITRSK